MIAFRLSHSHSKVWNVTIFESNWPALNLVGYEAYTLYIETAEPQIGTRYRLPIGLAQDNLHVWYGIMARVHQSPCLFFVDSVGFLM